MLATLSSLRIRNLALVEELEWRIAPGFTAVTGETGSGKSIIVGALQLILLRYTLAFITHAGQAVGCTRYHAVDQRLCGCLLSSLDRLSSNELLITQEAIAAALGVRREAVTLAAKRLQAAGVINYSRGHIAVLDRKNLESRACGCYAAVKKAVSRLMLAPLTGPRMAAAGVPLS